MDARDTRVPQLDEAPVVVLDAAQPADVRPVLVTAPGAARRPGSRLRRAVLLGVASGLLIAAAVAGWLVRGGDDEVVTTPATAPKPAAVEPLALRVDVPADVVAGQPAALVVHYSDGAGTFSGGTEEWGDEVGASSLTEGRCGTAAVAAGPAAGSYRASLAWSAAGTYTVKVAVSSYTCVDGTPVVEEATTSVTVAVAAAS